jgi:hypothetical protein
METKSHAMRSEHIKSWSDFLNNIIAKYARF